MARAATAPELANFRLDGQKSLLKLSIYKPSSVYTARVNQSTFVDPISQVTYDGGSGTLANVKVGMTMFVGSSAGAYDKGVCRIRSTPSATVFYVGLTSEINWAENDYITIVNDIELWAKPAVQSGDDVYIDYNVSYSDQHDDMDPVPVMGPDAVVKLSGASVTHQRDASDSWVLGSTISTYSWAATGPNTVVIDDNTAADPTFTFDTAGWYRIALTVTAANGKTATGYRWTHVEGTGSAATTDFTLEYCRGDYEAGGWQFDVILLDNAALTDFYDRALVILWADDTYGTSSDSIGPVTGYERVIAVGRIDQETVEWYPDYSRVMFEVHGTSGWLSKLAGFPILLTNATAEPTTWEEIQGLTVDKAIFHLVNWRSNVTQRVDVYKSGDTRYAGQLDASGDTLYDQLVHLAEIKILARPLSDRYGRLFIEVDTQYLASADRAAIPTVMTLTSADWSYIEVERQTRGRISMIEMNAEYNDGTDTEVILSKASGVIMTRYGSAESVDRILVASQSAANTLAGNVLAQRNNPYPNIDIEMPANMRLVDICPRQYLVMNIAAGDTERGIVWSSQKAIPRAVEFEWDSKTGSLTTLLEMEAETTGFAGQTVPYAPPPEFNIPPFDLGDLRLPSLGPIGTGIQPEMGPDEDPWDGDTSGCPTDAPANGPFPVPMAGTITDTGTYHLTGEIWKQARPSGHDNPTTYELYGRFEKYNTGTGVWEETAEDDFYNVIAYDGNGDAVATGVHDAVTNLRVRTGTLTPASVTTIRSVAVRIKNEYLFRPTVISSGVAVGSGTYTLASSNFTSYFLGGRARAVKQVSYTYNIGPNWTDISLYLQFGAANEYLSRSVKIEYVSSVFNSTDETFDYLEGFWKTGIASVQHWETEYSPAVYSGVKGTLGPYTIVPNGSNNAVKIWTHLRKYGGGYTGSANMSMVVDAYFQATYRIHINGLYLYNLCPR